MRPRRAAWGALALALLLAGSAAAGAGRYPAGRFEVAGRPVPAAAVLDARALPDIDGRPSLMVTLDAKTAAAIAGASRPDAPLAATLDGRPLGSSPAGVLASEHVLQLSGDFGDYNAAAALARRISGADPLPSSESD